MKIKIILSVVLMLLVVVGVIKTFPKMTQQPADPQATPRDGKLKWFADQAKGMGRQRIVIPARNVDYGGSSSATDLDEALSSYSAIVAQPVEEQSHAATPDAIVTWYKFRVVETLSPGGSTPCADCSPPEPPKNLLPLKDDELLLVKNGGSLIVEGVRIDMIDSAFPPFELGKKYLLFVSKHPSGVATIGLGPRGIFKVGDDDSVEGINNLPHPVKDALARRFNKSVKDLKQHLRNPPAKQ